MRVITGTARGRKLGQLQGMDTRPTTDQVKESIFNIIQFDIEGRRVLDLFAGTGQLGIECLSRGAASAVFVDRRPDAAALTRENLKLCDLTDRSRVVAGDSMEFLKAAREKYDLIFLDAQQKQENQVRAIRSFIQQDVDYIVLAPVIETGWDTVLKEAKSVGIPVIIVDRMVDVTDESLYAAWVGTDFRLQ